MDKLLHRKQKKLIIFPSVMETMSEEKVSKEILEKKKYVLKKLLTELSMMKFQ